MSSFYGTAPVNHTAAWHPEPTFRGTFSILSSCFTTMALCVWMAVHLNIPEHGHKGFVRGFITLQHLRKVKWLLIGLYAPEMVAWTAYEQRRTASEIYHNMKKQLKQRERPGFLKRTFCLSTLTRMLWKEMAQTHKSFDNRHDWTMMHSQYVAMGGFAVDVSDAQLQFLALKDITQFTLTVEGFNWMVDWGIDLVPNLSEAEICDKSKASALAKFLVCLQAIWFCAQCIARLSQNLAISLLELNTFAHAVCTLIIYVLWWDKPLDIEEPTILRGKNMKEATALFLLANADHKKGRQHGQRFYWLQKCPSLKKMIGVNTGVIGEEWLQPYDPLPLETPPKQSMGSINIRDCQKLDGQILRPCTRAIPGWVGSIKNGSTLKREISLNSTEYACLRMAIQEGLRLRVLKISRPPLTLRIQSFPSLLSKRGLCSGLILASFCYGGIHLTAWNAPFLTHVQMILWKVACLGTAAFGPVACIFLPLLLAWDDFEKSGEKDKKLGHIAAETYVSTVFYFGSFVLSLLILFYVFCRVFLVVECFIALSHLPDTVYEIPVWSRYFPHIG